MGHDESQLNLFIIINLPESKTFSFLRDDSFYFKEAE